MSRGLSHKVEDIWDVSHPGSLEILHMQNFWSVSAPRALGASLHQKLLGYLCIWSLSEHLHMQILWGVSAPRTPNTKLLGYHGTSGAFLHPTLLGLRALGASLTEISGGVSHPAVLEHFTPRASGVSLHSEPLEHLTPKTLGESHTLGSGALGPGLSCRQSTQEGSLSPAAEKTPTRVVLVAHPTPAPPRKSASLGATAQPQGARGAGREANSCGSARSGAAGEPEGSGTDPCRAVSSRAGS